MTVDQPLASQSSVTISLTHLAAICMILLSFSSIVCRTVHYQKLFSYCCTRIVYFLRHYDLELKVILPASPYPVPPISWMKDANSLAVALPLPDNLSNHILSPHL